MTLSLVLSSCSNDDSEPTPDPTPSNGLGTSTLEAPANAAVSAKYRLEAADNCPWSSIELTESGKYVILPRWYQPAYAPSKAKGKFATPAKMMSRSASDIPTGGFIKISDTEYLLEGFGTITIEGGNGSALSIIIARDGEEPITVGATEDSKIEDTQATRWLCRTWNVDNVTVKAYGNGKEIYSATAPGRDSKRLYDGASSALAQWFNKTYAQYLEDDEYMEAEDFGFDANNVSEITFTRAGSYLVTTPESELGISIWGWKEEGKGILQYSHDVTNLYSPEYSNNINVHFDDKRMSMFEVNGEVNEKEDGISISFKVTSTYDCSEY